MKKNEFKLETPPNKEIEITKIFSNENGTIQVVQRKLINLLNELGFGIFATTSKFLRGSIVKRSNNVISEVTEKQLRREVLDLLETSGVEEPYIEKFQRSISTVLSSTQIHTLKEIKADLLKDKKNTAYFPFENYLVKVTADSVECLDYANLSVCVMEKQRKSFAITTDNQQGGDFRRFCELVTNENTEWFKALQSSIGYLLLSNKEAIEDKAIIVYDYLIGNSLEANGGTGKSLIFKQAIGQLKSVAVIDGKRCNKDSARFMYQNVDEITDVILIDDASTNFNFEQVYSAITTGFEIERKLEQSVYLSQEEAPKFVITSNRLLKLEEGASARRRIHEVFLYNYFNDEKKPKDVFGKNFFSKEWTKEEYNKFYYFMFECVQVYLQNGLVEYLPEEIKEIKLKSEIGEKWYEFFNDVLEELIDEKDLINRRELEKLAKEEFKHFTAHGLTKKLKTYCKYLGFEYELINSGSVQKYKITVPKSDIVEQVQSENLIEVVDEDTGEVKMCTIEEAATMNVVPNISEDEQSI